MKMFLSLYNREDRIALKDYRYTHKKLPTLERVFANFLIELHNTVRKVCFSVLQEASKIPFEN